jgi:hypothetical protein
VAAVVGRGKSEEVFSLLHGRNAVNLYLVCGAAISLLLRLGSVGETIALISLAFQSFNP